MGSAKPILVEVAPGELIDKITILEIKAERIENLDQRRNISLELEVLEAARNQAVVPSGELDALTAELKQVNQVIWDVEDKIRDCERKKDFGPRFVEFARSVYRNNDHRCALKRQINELLGSKIMEEKSYADY